MRNLRRSKGNPGPVAALLKSVMPPGSEEKLALPLLREKWAAIVGDVLAAKTGVYDLDKGVLVVKAHSSASAKALSMRGATVARGASKVVGIPIGSVKVVVGAISLAPKETRKKSPTLVKAKKEEVARAFDEVRGNFSPEREEVARRLASLMALFKTRFPDK